MSADQFAETLSQWAKISIHRNMQEVGEFLRSAGISMPQISVLIHLRHHGASRVSDIGEHLGVTNAAASQMVQRLVEQGLLARTENAQDRRVKHITLTDVGTKLLRDVTEVRRSWITRLATALPEDQQDIVIQALELLIEAAKKNDEPTYTEAQS